MAFGEVLQRFRQEAELSQAGLARKAGISVRSVQNWEQGHREPSASAIMDLAKALGVSAEALLTKLEGKRTPTRPRARGRPRTGKN